MPESEQAAASRSPLSSFPSVPPLVQWKWRGIASCHFRSGRRVDLTYDDFTYDTLPRLSSAHSIDDPSPKIYNEFRSLTNVLKLKKFIQAREERKRLLCQTDQQNQIQNQNQNRNENLNENDVSQLKAADWLFQSPTQCRFVFDKGPVFLIDGDERTCWAHDLANKDVYLPHNNICSHSPIYSASCSFSCSYLFTKQNAQKAQEKQNAQEKQEEEEEQKEQVRQNNQDQEGNQRTKRRQRDPSCSFELKCSSVAKSLPEFLTRMAIENQLWWEHNINIKSTSELSVPLQIYALHYTDLSPDRYLFK